MSLIRYKIVKNSTDNFDFIIDYIDDNFKKYLVSELKYVDINFEMKIIKRNVNGFWRSFFIDDKRISLIFSVIPSFGIRKYSNSTQNASFKINTYYLGKTPILINITGISIDTFINNLAKAFELITHKYKKEPKKIHTNNWHFESYYTPFDLFPFDDF